MTEQTEPSSSSKSNEPPLNFKDVAPHFVGVPLELQPVFKPVVFLELPASSGDSQPS